MSEPTLETPAVKPEPPAATPAQAQPPASEPTSSEPQGDSYYQSLYNKLQASTARAVKLETWFDKNQTEVVSALQANQAPAATSSDFNLETDFDLGEAMSQPDSPSAQAFAKLVSKQVDTRIDGMESNMRQNSYLERLGQSGLTEPQQKEYWALLNNMDDQPDVVFGTLAKAWQSLQTQPPPSDQLTNVLDNKNTLPPAVGVPTQPVVAPNSETEYLDRIVDIGKDRHIKIIRR